MHNYKSIIASMVLALTLPFASYAQGLGVTAETPTVTQNFDSMYDASTQTATLEMPSGWRMERNMSAPRTVGSFDAASTTLMYSGGTSLASNASNGTWNFGSSADPSDRAVGGLTTTVSNGTRGLNLMTAITNNGTQPIERLTFSYDIEKYRKGSNTAGFAVQLYTSADGTTWTAAGEDFYTLFSPDGATEGAAEVPISTTSVNNVPMLIDVAVGQTVYLAWNISVASGSSPNLAPGLALDNISITATFTDPSAKKYGIYVEDVTGWANMAVYATDGTLGEYPGAASAGTKTVNGVSYRLFEFEKAPFKAVINNTLGKEYDSVDIAALRDYYFCASPYGLDSITDPTTYTGWVDPTIPPFKSSGIYLRGEVNSWGADTAWEFSDEGDGVYSLYNKTLSGQFKVADASWSSACNWGSNGSSILPDTDYALKARTDDNISCGSNAYTAKQIRLTIVNDSTATLYIKSDDDPTGLTTVYVIGDNNSWNYMDDSGALALDTADGLFKGTVSMPKGTDGLSHWRIYQRLGMGGPWGAADADMTESALSGTLVKGSTYNAAVAPGTYAFTFNLETGAYTLEKQAASVVDMTLNPADVTLVPELPETVKVLSLNNSLIYYNDQAAVFNSLCAAIGRDGSWTKHTLLGKSLATHWAEGDGVAEDGTPSAKMMVRSDAWSHIILQEQSGLPRTNVETFRENIRTWVEYIRENCPNPNVVIIIPENWGYSSDWDNFLTNNAQFSANTLDVATETGAVVVPVGDAYSAMFSAEGREEMATMFQDDRHPTDKATYMAALLEYAVIYNVDPATITWHPSAVTDAEAEQMRKYASQTFRSFVNNVDHHASTVRFQTRLIDENGLEMDATEPFTYTVSGGGTISDTGVFTADGTLGEYTVTAVNGTFTRTAKVKVAKAETQVITYPAILLDEETLTASENFDEMGDAADARLPEAWRIDRQTVGPRTLGTYAVADTVTMYAGGVSLASNAKNGTWNFGDNAGTDRAVGGITTGVDNGSRAINVYTHLLNTGAKNIENVVVSYDVEKYRSGSNTAGFAVQLYYSMDGRNWTSAGDRFYTYVAPESKTAGYDSVPGEVYAVSDTLPTVIYRGCDLYLAWNISAASGDNCASAPALAIDNFTLSGSLPEIPTASHYIYALDETGWDYLGLYAWGDSELFGSWPGEGSVDVREEDGVTYKVFLFEAESGSYNLIFNNWNNGSQAPDYTVKGGSDYYLRVTATGVTEWSGAAPSRPDLAPDLVITFRDGQVTAPGASAIAVYTLTGVQVAVGQGTTLGIADLPTGVYIVRAIGPTAASACKIAK